VAGEVAHVFPVLPHGVGAEAVHENEAGLAWLLQLGHPAVHGGPLAEVRGDGAEPRGGEEVAVDPVPRGGEAEAFGEFRQHGKRWLKG